MRNHYLMEPTARTSVADWEKGQVENQAGLVRERFFTSRLRFASYEELNAWLHDRCLKRTHTNKHIIRHGDDIVAEHVRRFGRAQTIYDPWHYVPVLAKKLGALRNGAPFKQLALPPDHRDDGYAQARRHTTCL